LLKVRVMPVLLHSDVGLVKGIAFDSWRRVGTAMPAVKVYNLREVDELVFLDITATRDGRAPDLGIVEDIAGECFVPLTVGGGIRAVDDVRRLLMAGADKVCINSAGVEEPALIGRVADRFGSQCVVMSVDARLDGDRYEVWTRSGATNTGLDPVEVAAAAEAMGAGEILITSIDRDGTMTGYDVELVRRVADAVTIPVVASGGAGSYEHMATVLAETKATAVAAASMFHFTEQTPREAKGFLAQKGFPVRL
jgi:cyclase